MGIALFFGKLLSGFLALLGNIWEWCCTHPKAAIAIVVLVLSVGLAWHFGGVHQANKDAVQITALKGEIKKANDETLARNAHIKKIEADSKVSADALDKKLAETKTAMANIVRGYEKKLADEKKKNRTVTLKVPETGKSVEVEINPAGQVVCSRVHDATFEMINDLVREANRP
jgi:hypothetical protein